MNELDQNLILDECNTIIRKAHGNRVSVDSLFSDSDLDSLGTFEFFIELDEKYGCFKYEWFCRTEIKKLKMRDIIGLILDSRNRTN